MILALLSDYNGGEMKIAESDISIKFAKDEQFWDVEAFWRNTIKVGYARCEQQGDRLVISDLKVEDECSIPWPFGNGFLVILGFAFRKVNFRGRGIGSKLLTRILSEATTTGMREVWGSVTQSDIAKTPGLLQWYEQMGFVVSEPHACISTAIKKITKKISNKTQP